MRLKINGFENEINFNNEMINVLIIDDSKCFSHIIQIINDKINGMYSNELYLLDDNDIVPNLKLFLSYNELLDLYKYSLYNNVNLLLIERFNSKKLKYENILYIDENFDEQII